MLIILVFKTGILFDGSGVTNKPLMKRFIPLLVLFSIGITANAQLEKGRHFIGGQTTLLNGDIYATKLAISAKYPETEYGFNLIPTYGYAVARNWLIGAQATLGYTYVSDEFNMPEYPTHYYDMGIAPFTRLYLDLSKNGQFKVFGMAALEFVTIKTRYTSTNSTSTYQNMVGTIGGGLSYFTKKQLSIDLNYCAAGIRLGVYKAFGRNKGK
jgi:opacity protein-like surface antigen